MPNVIPDQSAFQPTWVSSPGETIVDVLHARRISVDQFAEAMQQSVEDMVALLEGRTAITIAFARRLSEVLGASVEFWMSRDHFYREGAGRLQAEHRDWLDALPIGDMIRFGWISPAPHATEEVSAALRFFGMPSVEAWEQAYAQVGRLTAFRSSASFESKHGAVAAWLREGERRATSLPCQSWDPELFRSVLGKARRLSRIGDPARFLLRLQEICSSAGVAVVPLRAPAGCRASGATKFISPNKALLLVSFRHLTDDHFWHTFFHEAGHLLLHGPTHLFVEGLGDGSPEGYSGGDEEDLFSVHEREADDFATRTLIPQEAEAALRRLQPESTAILRFATKIGISPGVVVGQMQHIGRIRHNQLNSLKRRYEWAEDAATVARRARQPRKAR